ncbi:MAG: L,D-transpeptidase [Actinomycetota bacterium]|nr:L,D-transpeptidase [Actinomycetota bacterium]
MRRRLLLSLPALSVALAAGLLGPGLASAAAAAPAKTAVRLSLRGAFVVHGSAVTVPGRGFAVAGVTAPYVPGQTVSVITRIGSHQIRRDRLRIKPSANGRTGRFTEALRSPAAGRVQVTVTHHRTAQMLGFIARQGVASLTPQAGPGSSGPFVELMQQRLLALHVYLPASGVFDERMSLALDAYHRLLGRGVSQALDPATVSALLNGEGAFKVLHPRDGKHVEGNLGRQLLALINGSQVYRIYPISSGKASTPTILGHFRVYQRDPGYLPDGMYFSSFFSGGYAIHGYNPAPDYPASHGCMRVPIVDAISIYNWLTYGNIVDVYYP